MTDDELLLTAIHQCKRSDLYSSPRLLTPDQEFQYNEMKACLAQGEPIQYVVGFTEFMGYRVDVNPKVLIPRPETEILVQHIVRQFQDKQNTRLSVCDVGTGSGCISIALAKLLNNVSIDAVDLSQQAIECAQANTKCNAVDKCITFYCADMFQFFKKDYSGKPKYDVIVSNPPYIKTDEMKNLPSIVQREPTMALDGGGDGLLFYRHLISTTFHYLKPNGFLVMEIGDAQRLAIENLLAEQEAWGKISFHKDYVGTDRIVFAWKN